MFILIIKFLPMLKKQNKLIIFFYLFFITILKLNAQTDSLDFYLIKNKPLISSTEFLYYKTEGNDQKVMQVSKHSTLQKINPIAYLFKGAMLLYQNVISQQLSKICPYEITCSNYSKQAIKKYGIAKGIFLGADRLMRCNRISILDVNLSNINEHSGKIIDNTLNLF
ncbi:MAG: membrane protein insertion efficiency factor YidD [Bacteroidetes bacterium]|nr:membrane protein insertion efficiency factor YidD [Bacteroidota bacterium]